MRKHLLVILCAGVMLYASGQVLRAAPPARNFTVDLKGANEVPARVTNAQGTATLHLNPAGTELRLSVTVQRMTNIVGAHIHSGAAGVNGPIVFGFYAAAPAAGPHNGLLARATIERGVTPLPAALGATLTDAERFDALVTLLRSGNSYINVHSDDGVAPTNTGPGDFPGGEIRGPIVPRP